MSKSKEELRAIKRRFEELAQEAREYFQQKDQDELAKLSPEKRKEMFDYYKEFLEPDEIEPLE